MNPSEQPALAITGLQPATTPSRQPAYGVVDGLAEPEPYLQIEDVNKSFGNFVALKNIFLNVYPGEFVCLLGPSGCGKTTLLRIIAGLEEQSSGRVIQGGKNVSNLPPAQRDFGIVFQSFHLLGTMNAFDNVRAPLEIAGLANVDDLARSALSAVGLAQRLDHYPGQLSGGERQRVAVARALASNPAIVFADEPTGNLDRATGGMVADMLFAIARQRNATLVVVTHDAEIAKRADRIDEMSDGRVV